MGFGNRQVHKKAQSATEYGIMVAAVVAALLVMNIYYARAKRGYMKKYSDALGSQYSLNNTSYDKLTAVEYKGGSTGFAAINATKGRIEENGRNYYSYTDFKKNMLSSVTGGTVEANATLTYVAEDFFDLSGVNEDALEVLDKVNTGFDIKREGAATETLQVYEPGVESGFEGSSL